MSVFIIDKDNNPLMPCSEKRAHQLLDKKQAVAIRRFPFVLKLLDYKARRVKNLRIKIDPGSSITGLALLDENRVIWLGEIHHRTNIVDRLRDRSSTRRRRRSCHTRYRAARFDNRCRPKGWIAPSIEARVNQICNAIAKLQKYVPIGYISMELVKFDTQKMMNPEISGAEYQQGTLLGYEIRTYIQEKFHHTCIYCGKKDYESRGTRFQIEHVMPRSRGGSDRVSNLAWSCEPCNAKKNTKTAAEFGHPEVMNIDSVSLKNAAEMNTSRFRLYERLQEFGLPVECGTGGMTAMNRARLNLPKSHCFDAVCVGASTPEKIDVIPKYFDIWKAMGRGSRQIMQSDSFGFPKHYRARNRRVSGFATGDIVEIVGGKYAGKVGRLVAVKDSPYITSGSDRMRCRYKKIFLIQQTDGWSYSKEQILVVEHPA